MLERWGTQIRWGILAILAVFGFLYYRGMIEGMLLLYTYPVEDMSHAYVVPFVSLYALWIQRKHFARVAGGGSWAGFGWIVFFLVLTWFGGRGGQARMEMVAMIGLIWAIPYALWGKGVARLMAFPAGFLLFTVPMSSYLSFTVYLRIFSTWFAATLLNGFNMAVEQNGTMLASRVPGGEFQVDVAEACSGIRSLVAMMALYAGVAFFWMKTRFQRWALFACAIPMAVIGNICRLLIVCLVARFISQAAATEEPYHGYYGFVTFGVGVFVVSALIPWLPKCEQKVAHFLPQWLQTLPEVQVPELRWVPQWRRLFLLGLILLLPLATFRSNLWIEPAFYDAYRFVAETLPESLPGYVGDCPWYCHDTQCANVVEERELKALKSFNQEGYFCPVCKKKMYPLSVGEKSSLPADTEIMKRTYRSADGVVFSANVVLSGRYRGSIHRAELCLPSQGFVILKTETKTLRVPGGRPQKVRVITAQQSGSTRQFALVYWFESRMRACDSHENRILVDIWDRSIHNRINRWAMVAVNVSIPLDSAESIGALEAFFGEFCPQVFKPKTARTQPNQ